MAGLHQDRTSIDHDRLTGGESFLDEKQIGLRYIVGFADAAHRQILTRAFIQVLPFVGVHTLPKVGSNEPRRHRVDKAA